VWTPELQLPSQLQDISAHQPVTICCYMTKGLAQSHRAAFYTSDPDYDFEELCNEANQRLFNTILESPCHVLEQMLPPALPQSHDFRKRLHTKQIPNCCSYLNDWNFLIRMLYADSYLF